MRKICADGGRPWILIFASSLPNCSGSCTLSKLSCVAATKVRQFILLTMYGCTQYLRVFFFLFFYNVYTAQVSTYRYPYSGVDWLRLTQSPGCLKILIARTSSQCVIYILVKSAEIGHPHKVKIAWTSDRRRVASMCHAPKS